MHIHRERLARLRRNTMGAVAVEYAFLVAFVAAPMVIGITAGGVEALNDFRHGREQMLKPTP